MIEGGISVFQGRRVLLLQGPVGPFFRRLAEDLQQVGAAVFKVNFNGGDWLFYPGHSFNFRGLMDDWPAYFESLLDELDIDVVMLFGDCRAIHRAAYTIASFRKIDIAVFEEGYIRPNYITLEQSGVNSHSLIPRTPIFYLNRAVASSEPPLPVGNTFWFAVRWAVLYYLAASLLFPLFRHYRHHRPLTWREGLPWVRAVVRKWQYAVRERGVAQRLATQFEGRFFLVPLQVYNDSQIRVHSEYGSVDDFIEDVMNSFAKHAPPEVSLVIKHHPMDRGYCDYSAFIARRARELGLQERCLYIHDQHLPTLIRGACGVVVVNSTVGLSALFHGVPVKTCGSAMYDIKGLTFRGPLNEFWNRAEQFKPDRHLYRQFHDYLVLHTQLNGSFYKPLPLVASVAGLKWRLTPREAPAADVRKIDRRQGYRRKKRW